MKTQFDRADWADSKEEVHGKLLFVGYLSVDSDPENPQKEWDGEGVFYLSRDRDSIWNDPDQVRSHLCCSSGRWEGEQPDIDYEFDPGTGVKTTLRDLAADQFYEAMDDDKLDEWLNLAEWNTEGYAGLKAELKPHILEGFFNDGPFSEEVEQKAIALYPQYWQRMAGPYVVPIAYNSERGQTDIFVTSWDGDPDDLPDGIWVGGRSERDNIGVNGTFEEIVERARQYAEGVCETMTNWCNGNVYGVCYEAYELDEDGEPGEMVAEDACWGHFGDEYAEQAMREGFDDFVRSTLEDLRIEAEKKTFPPGEIGV